jgi:hypothetical protein
MSTVRTVSLHHVLKHSTYDEGSKQFLLDGQPLHFAYFVGMVVEGKEKHTARMSMYNVRDAHSAPVVCALVHHMPTNAAANGQEEADPLAVTSTEVAEPSPDMTLERGVYYAFHGVFLRLDKARGQPATRIHFHLQHARRVADMNEVTFYGLDCVHTHLKLTRV